MDILRQQKIERYIMLFFAGIMLVLFLWYYIPARLHQPMVSFRNEKIYVLVADTPAKRQQGLSSARPLKSNEGMLFIFELGQLPEVWMKDMFFDLDIIWIDNNQQVVDIKQNVHPDSYPEIFKPRVESRYVLEVPAGWVEKQGLELGDILEFTNI